MQRVIRLGIRRKGPRRRIALVLGDVAAQEYATLEMMRTLRKKEV